MKQDVILLGGGIIGATLGYFLARAGFPPLLIEPNTIAGGTTGSSFAWANGSTKTSDAAYHRLNADGLALHHDLIETFGTKALGVRQSGALHVVDGQVAADHSTMLLDLAALKGFGYNAHLVDNRALCELEPHLKLAPEHVAMHLPDDLILDAPRFTRSLVAQMCQLGGKVLSATPSGLIADDNGVISGVETEQGTHLAPLVITTAGKDTGQLLANVTGYAPFASRFPVRKVPGLLLTTPPLAAQRLRHLLYTAVKDELHMLPTPDGGLKIGSDDIDALIWQDHSQKAQRAGGTELLKRATKYLPGFADQIRVEDCHLQIGVRAVPEDGQSIISPLPGAEGLWIIATHSGVTLAPIIAQLVSEWVSSGHQPARLAPFTLSRFPGFS